MEQTCPHCGKVNVVAGLYFGSCRTGTDDTKQPPVVKCAFCDHEFVAVEHRLEQNSEEQS